VGIWNEIAMYAAARGTEIRYATAESDELVDASEAAQANGWQL